MSIHQPPEKAQKTENNALKSLPARRPNGPECSPSLENIEIKHPQNKIGEVETVEIKQLPTVFQEFRILQDGSQGGVRLKKIIKHRTRSKAILEHAEQRGYKGDITTKFEKMAECGSYVRMRHWTKVNKTRVVAANFCKCFILCTMCAALRASKYAEKLLLVLFELAKEQDVYGRPLHCVLSIKNRAELDVAIEQVKGGIGCLLKHRRESRKGSRHKSALKPVEGGVVVIEIKKGKNSKLWHVHAHCLFLSPVMIDQDALREEWRQATKSRKVAIPWLKWIGLGENDLLKAVLEQFKYTVKPGSCTPAELIQVHKTVFGKYRLIQTFGCLRGVKINEDDLAEKGREEWGPFMDYFLSCSDMNNNYRVTRIAKSEDIEADEDQGFEVDEEMASWWDDGEPEEAPF